MSVSYSANIMIKNDSGHSISGLMLKHSCSGQPDECCYMENLSMHESLYVLLAHYKIETGPCLNYWWVIYYVDGRTCYIKNDFCCYLSSAEANQTVTIILERNGVRVIPNYAKSAFTPLICP